MPTVVDGTSGAIIPVSDTTTMSQAKRPASATSRASKLGLPTSSSPSTSSFRLTGRRPVRASNPRAASIW